jgi:selenide,water dikinase
MASNEEHFAGAVVAGGSAPVAPDRLALLYDPQTSGGLLIAANAEYADEIAASLERAHVRAARIGRVRPKSGDTLIEIMV